MHCPSCAYVMHQAIPAGDTKERHLCARCGHIHYENPKMVVGTILEHEQSILLCRRAIDPCHGMWTIPGGFMENGESAMQGAARETLEEANARATDMVPFCHLDIPHIGQAYILYRGRFLENKPIFAPGEESLETELRHIDTIPWDTLAFSVVKIALQLYTSDKKDGQARYHQGVIGSSTQMGARDAKLERVWSSALAPSEATANRGLPERAD